MDAILQNIFEQAEVIHELNARYLARAEAFAQLAGRHFHRIMITGMGTSYFGGYPAFLYLQEHGLHNVLYVDASELLHYQMTTIADDTLLILISQSGESFEIVHILERIKKADIHPFIIGVTMTDAETTLRRHATLCLAMARTEETTLGAFKSFTAAILVLLILSCYLCQVPGGIKVLSQQIISLTNIISEQIESWANWAAARARTEAAAFCFIGRGPCLGAAQAGALIATEMAKVNAMVYSGGQFRHGPIETASNQSNQYIVLAPAGTTREICVRLALDLSAMNEKVLLLTSDHDVQESNYLQVLRMPSLDEYLAPILYSVPLQFYAYHLTLHRGIVPGTARFISKVTRHE